MKSNAMKRVKITEDGFVWKILTKNEAEAVLDSGCFSLYALYEDDETHVKRR